MNQNLKSALIAAGVAGAIAAPVAGAATYSVVDQRQNAQIRALQTAQRTLFLDDRGSARMLWRHELTIRRFRIRIARLEGQVAGICSSHPGICK